MAKAVNGYLVTKPSLPPQVGCRNIEVIRVISQEESRVCDVRREEGSVGVRCAQGCGVYKSRPPSLAPETSGLAMMVYLLQLFKLGVPPGTGRQVFLLSSWKQRRRI